MKEFSRVTQLSSMVMELGGRGQVPGHIPFSFFPVIRLVVRVPDSFGDESVYSSNPEDFAKYKSYHQ